MNVIDYLKINGHKSFSKLPFNEIDALVLAQLSYLEYNRIHTSFMDIIDTENLNSYETSILLSKREFGDCENDEKLIREFLNSKRYHGVKLAHYIKDHSNKRFSAITFLFDDFICISYMGTDDSVVGWKEDFSMSYLSVIPSQSEGKKYLEKISKIYDKPIILTGHSKGGNVAVYSYLNIDEYIQKRIVKVYSYDAPGFSKEFIDLNAIKNRKDVIDIYIPESSIIGLIMYQIDDYKIISSNKIFVFQHNIYNWRVDEIGFIYKDSLTKNSQAFSLSNKEWLENFSNEEKKMFFESIFSLFEDNEIVSILELKKNFKNKVSEIIDSSSKITYENKQLMKKIIKNMISSYLRLLFDRKK